MNKINAKRIYFKILYTKAQERGKDFTLEASMNKIYQLIES